MVRGRVRAFVVGRGGNGSKGREKSGFWRVLERKGAQGVQAAGRLADAQGMDTGTIILEHGTGLVAGRLAGELAWRMDREGRMLIGRGGMVEVWASGRVCPEAMIGVVETMGGRAAVLGLLPRGLVDVLAGRFPGVRWAVADVVPSATAR
jgi:hypothetical protein